MKEKFRLTENLLWKASGCFLVGSTLVFADQIRRIDRRIRAAVSTDVLSIDRYRPHYIYIEDPFVQEKIEEGYLLNDERVKLTRFHRWVKDKLEESFIFRNWLSYKKNQAWRFLRLAQSDEHPYRIRAVKSLASIGNLSDSDYQQLAQACDLRTTVGLARTKDINLKFFLDPPYYKLRPDKKAILRHLHDFLLALNSDGKHPCLQYFISKIFNDSNESDYKLFDDDLGYSHNSGEFIPMCVEALLHHSWLGGNAKDIVTLGGLPLLMEVYKYLQHEDPENVDSLVLLARLMSNISVYEECCQDFYKSGWLKILAALSKHSDVRVSTPAARALLNFDKDDTSDEVKYHRRIYPLYPLLRKVNRPKLDVIFIHGLLGGVFITWRQRESGVCTHKSALELLGFGADDYRDVYNTNKPLDPEFIVDVHDITDWEHLGKDFELVLPDIPVDSNMNATGPFSFPGSAKMEKEYDSPSKCWPKDWLSNDCPETRIIGINYETNISMWTPMCPLDSGKRNLKDRSNALMQALIKAGVGKRPIVWVGHSMGGLIVKDMLVQSSTSKDPAERSLFEETKGIVFYSTPHKGSHVAALNPTTQMILWPSMEVQELRENSPALLALHDSFLSLMKIRPIKVISFAERESTYITSLKFEIRFVDSTSAEADVGELYGIPLDHLCICKPSGRRSFIYQKVLNLIKDVLRDIDKTKL